MQITLSTGVVTVTGVPPYARAAVLAAHPLPEPPLLQIRRADGGVDLWPDANAPAYRQALAETLRVRDAALWQFYLLRSLQADPPDDDAWRADLAYVGVAERPGPEGRKLDWVEYVLLATDADVQALRAAFRDLHEATDVDRKTAEAFFDATWDGRPLREAAGGLPVGKLRVSRGYTQFDAALRSHILPFSRYDLPDVPALLYYDLPPRLRTLLETYWELRDLAEALRLDEAYTRRDR